MQWISNIAQNWWFCLPIICIDNRCQNLEETIFAIKKKFIWWKRILAKKNLFLAFAKPYFLKRIKWLVKSCQPCPKLIVGMKFKNSSNFFWNLLWLLKLGGASILEILFARFKSNFDVLAQFRVLENCNTSHILVMATSHVYQ